MDGLTLAMDLISSRVFALCETCGKAINADGKCHDTEGLPSDPYEGAKRLGAAMARKKEQAVMDALTGDAE